MAKLEARALALESQDAAHTVASFNSRTGAVTLVLGDVTPLVDSRYVLKSGDTMTGELTVQTTSPVQTILSVVNNSSPGGVAGSGGAAVLSLRSATLASYEWRIQADGPDDQLLFQDGGFNTRMWLKASSAVAGGSFLGIGAPLFGILPVLLHNSGAGKLLLTNLAQTDFDRIQFGGITSAFPALQRTATVLECILADDSARAQLYAATLRTTQTTVAALPAAATAGVGAHAFVTDANATKTVGDGTTVVGGGANQVPVYSDGTNWIIG